ncbi:MAG TPA: hypothetical protein VJ915_07715, partial [Balneolaceae bacterium]|nr:hypothetical protein [Balneolaceae bacterium]
MQYFLFFFMMQLMQLHGGFEASELEVRSYTPQQFAAHGQNWGILHASDGLLYTGNRYGILQYDGAEWTLIQSPDRRAVLSLTEDSGGSIYAGAEEMFAKLVVQEDGSTGFMSLNHLFPGSGPEGSIYYMAANSSGNILFTDQERLFLYTGDEITLPDLRLRFPLRALESINDSFLVVDGNGALFLFDGDSSDSIRRITDRSFIAAAALPDGNIVVATKIGLMRVSLKTFEKTLLANTDGVDYGSIHELLVNDRGEVVAGTNRNGVYIFSPEGDLIHHLMAGKGLSDNAVNRLGKDRDGGVWISQNRVLYRLGVSSGIRVYSDNEGLYGIVEQSKVHNGSHYISGSRGVFRLEPDKQIGEGRIGRVEGIRDECFGMVSRESGLLVACNSGIYLVEDLEGKQLAELTGSIVLTESGVNKDRVYVGTTDGLYILEYTAGRWVLNSNRIPGVSGFIRHIVEARDGSVWIATRLNDLQRLTGISSDPEMATVKVYGPENGLPDSRYRVFNLFGEVIVSTSDGLYRFDGADSFVPDTRFVGLIPGDGMPNRMSPTSDGSILFSNGYDNGVLVQDEAGDFNTVLLAEGRFPWQLT